MRFVHIFELADVFLLFDRYIDGKIHIQIIYFIIDDLLNHNNYEVAHSLILTGPEYSPYELAGNNLLIRREDIQTTQEEADTIIIQQMG